MEIITGYTTNFS